MRQPKAVAAIGTNFYTTWTVRISKMKQEGIHWRDECEAPPYELNAVRFLSDMAIKCRDIITRTARGAANPEIRIDRDDLVPAPARQAVAVLPVTTTRRILVSDNWNEIVAAAG